MLSTCLYASFLFYLLCFNCSSLSTPLLFSLFFHILKNNLHFHSPWLCNAIKGLWIGCVLYFICLYTLSMVNKSECNKKTKFKKNIQGFVKSFVISTIWNTQLHSTEKHVSVLFLRWLVWGVNIRVNKFIKVQFASHCFCIDLCKQCHQLMCPVCKVCDLSGIVYSKIKM